MPDVILKDQFGKNNTYEDIDTVILNTDLNGGTTTYISEHLIKNQVQANWAQEDATQPDYILNKPTTFEGYEHPDTHPASMIEGLSKVATTGKYEDLENAPKVYEHPDKHPASMIEGLAEVATTGKYEDLEGTPEPYTHPETHPASMITDLQDVAKDGKYDSLKNKPFFNLPALEEQAITFEQIEEGYPLRVGVLPGVWEKLLGETFIITWDDTTYTCVCKNAHEYSGLDNIHYLGNMTKILGAGWGEDTSEPFCVVIIADMNSSNAGLATVHTDSDANYHYISINPVNTVKRMDPKYLPKWDDLPEKPFGEMPPVATDIVITPFKDVDGFYGAKLPEELILHIGEEYVVTWDDSEYTCKSIDITDITINGNHLFTESMPILGNTTLFIGQYGTDTGEPFLLTSTSCIVVEGDTDEHTISIRYANPIKKIDPKYLPDGVGPGSSIPSFTTEIDLFPKKKVENFHSLSAYNGLYGTGYNFPESGYTEYLTDSFELVLGETYYVEWDGTEYEVTPNDASDIQPGALFIGNGAPMDLPGNGEPFAIGWVHAQGITFISIDQLESHIIRIYQKVTKSGISWNDISDKPFYDYQSTIVADASTFTDVSFEALDMTWIKITNEIIPRESVVGTLFSATLYGELVFSESVDHSMILANEDLGIGVLLSDTAFVVAYDTGEMTIDVMGMSVTANIPEPGIYIVGLPSESVSIKFTFGQIHKLDNKYLEFMTVEPDKVIIPKITGELPLIRENTDEPEKYVYGIADTDIGSVFSAVEAGKTYRVVIDGEEFILTSQDESVADYVPEGVVVNKFVVLGNMSILGLDPSFQDSGEPFLLVIMDGVIDGVQQQECMFAIYGGGTTGNTKSITFSITQPGSAFIDPAYLPSGIGSGSSDSSLPEVSTSDDGKVMTVVNGEWVAQEFSVSHPTELPNVTEEDNDKVLTVVNGTWTTAPISHPTELPSVSTSDVGKFLRVGADGNWIVETIQDVSEVGL